MLKYERGIKKMMEKQISSVQMGVFEKAFSSLRPIRLVHSLDLRSSLQP